MPNDSTHSLIHPFIQYALTDHFWMPSAMLGTVLNCVKFQPKSEFSSKCNIHRIINRLKMKQIF